MHKKWSLLGQRLENKRSYVFLVAGQVNVPGETQHPSRVHQRIMLLVRNLLFHYGNK